MRSLRNCDLAEEVALIQKKLQRLSVDGASPDKEADGDENSTSDGERVEKGGSEFFSTTGAGFDLLVYGPGGNGGGEARHKRLVREAARNTSGVHGAADRRTAKNVQCGSRRPVSQPFSHLLVCDFEATCDSSGVGYPNEIIEFPVVCVDTAKLCVVAEFHSYVRPKNNPRLTSFCTSLTGITQAQVDAAPTLPEVLARFDAWLRETVYPLCRAWAAGALSDCLRAQQRNFVYDEERNPTWVDCEKMVCIVTDGPWDMRKFMYECSVVRDGHTFPPLFYRWVNLRHSFTEHFRTRPRKLTDMLRKLRLTFHGRPHSGIDDSRNIARILIELLRRGYRVRHVSTITCVHTSGDSASEVAQLLEEEESKKDTRPRQQRGGKGKSGRNTPTAGKRSNRRR